MVVGRVHELLPGAIANLPIVKFLVLGAFGLLLVDRRTPDLLRPLVSRHGRYMLLYLAAILLSIPFSVYVGASLEVVQRMLVPTLAVLLVLIAALHKPADLDLMLRTVVVSIICLAAGMLLGLGDYQFDGGSMRQSISQMYDPNDLALLAAVSVPLALFFTRGRTSRFWWFLGWLGFAAAAVIVVRTGSRGGFIAFAVALVPSLLSARSALSVKARVGLLVALLAAVPFLPDSFRDRVASLVSLEKDYNMTEQSGRLELIKRGTRHFLERPLTGVGFAQFAVADGLWAERSGLGSGFKWMAAHNMYIQVAAEIGLGGIVGFLGILVANLGLGRRSRKLHRASTIDSEQCFRGMAIRDATLAFAVGGAFLSAAYGPVFVLVATLGIAYSGQLSHAAMVARRAGRAV